MKRFLIFFLLITVLLSCSSDDNRAQRNPFLQEVSFRYTINLNLPSFDNLRFTGGSLLIQDPGAGIRGIIVYNLNGTTFLAWEASCPNHAPNSCSTMSPSSALATCSCENYQYSLGTGGPLSESDDGTPLFPLLNYSTVVSGSNVIVSN
ncbi:hypothetical protein ACFQ1M_14965 [Sungkyunkwania multivorans]|uniref:Rieske domain-containing protein n=1 Tax=Sungkyunkwania multivorans TaxID=1173618 RepID=A0ABW3D0W7_9FLAO